jgi:hypothetical protein
MVLSLTVGAGGAGFQSSWGMAEKAAELLEKVTVN